MATTTNFGWETPDDTDLVKDGALAMRTLGNAIDTSLVDLKGGTTGQVLSKTSNTDMDFTWVTSDDANAIQNAIVDAKGDLITATAADTPARLAVGSNGDTLVADSAAATGLRYTAGVGLTQPVINGGMDVWQRGTSFSVSSGAGNVYTADRWQAYRGATGLTVSRQSTNDTTNLPFIQYCARVQRDSGNTSGNSMILTQSLETTNSLYYAGKTVTMSFYARAGANYSPTSSALTVQLLTGTGTDQNSITGFTGQSAVINSTATLTTTWQRFSYSVTLASTITQLAPFFFSVPTGTASTNDWFEITGIQLDVGNTALPFRRSGGTIQGELAACQRYYQRFTSGSAYGYIGALCGAYTTTNTYAYRPALVEMRVAPTSIDTGGNLRLVTAADVGTAVTTITNSSQQTKTALSLNVAVASGLSSGTYYQLQSNNDTTAYVGFSAEL
jgi:hypothetical protein